MPIIFPPRICHVRVGETTRRGRVPWLRSVRMVRLPFYFGLTREEQDRVIDGVLNFVQSDKIAR